MMSALPVVDVYKSISIKTAHYQSISFQVLVLLAGGLCQNRERQMMSSEIK